MSVFLRDAFYVLIAFSLATVRFQAATKLGIGHLFWKLRVGHLHTMSPPEKSVLVAHRDYAGNISFSDAGVCATNI